MIAVRFGARVIVVAVACTLATYAFGWGSLPIVGFLSGVAERRSRGAGSVAAVGAAAAWAAVLGADAMRGANIGAVSEQMGAVMHVPRFMFGVMTLVFAAFLCGAAAVIGAASTRPAI
jgi:hypothetical protein